MGRFCMCGSQRSYGPFLGCVAAKGLRGLNLPSEGFGIVTNCDPAEGLGIRGAVRIATITAQFTKYK